MARRPQPDSRRLQKMPVAGGRPWLAGVVHLAALPGAPRFSGSIVNIIKKAIADARVYESCGFDAVIVENFGDSPFYPGRVPPETIAALTAAACALRAEIQIPLGVNCLRNDGVSAIAIAAAANLQFIRVNVLAGAAVADQGIVVSEAHEVLRARARLAPNVQIFADVHVKHAAPLAPRPVEEDAADLVERAGADALIVSGTRTGFAPDSAAIEKVVNAIGRRAPVLIGSGLTLANSGELLKVASGAIVGTSVKAGGKTTNPVDRVRAAALVRRLRAGREL